MATVRQVLASLETIAPRRFTYEGDKVGLQVGNLDAPVTRALVSLDRSLAAVAEAKRIGAELLLTHHPLIFAPIQTVDSRRHDTRTVLALAESKIAFIAAHTNWDSAQGGINDTLASLLGLTNVKSFGHGAEVARNKIVFFVPVDHAEAVLDAAVAAGAGAIGAFERCAFFGPGSGTFRRHEHAPETVAELRVETVAFPENTAAVIRAIIKAHPYEEVAYDVYPLAGYPEQPAGRVGDLAAPLPFREFLAFVDRQLEVRSLAWGDPNRPIRRVAVVGGSADSEWMAAQRANADVLVTGEVKQHIALEASESGMAITSSGHYATEHPGSMVLRDRMEAAMPEIEWIGFVPSPGQAGRPFFD